MDFDKSFLHSPHGYSRHLSPQWDDFALTSYVPFGITSAPEYFQKCMSQILEGLEGVLCQITDVLMHSKDQDERGTEEDTGSWSHTEPRQV